MAGWTVRPSTRDDLPLIDGLLSGAGWKHFHLDWLQPTALVGRRPFLMATAAGLPVACLGCPPDVPSYAWVRAFAVTSGSSPGEAWSTLWNPAVEALVDLGVERIGVLASESWFDRLLIDSGFELSNAVLFYQRPLASSDTLGPSLTGVRPIAASDRESILRLDHSAFEPAWQLSSESLEAALAAAASATAIELDDELIAYQITTGSPLGYHLARLAVEPQRRRAGLGSALTQDAIRLAAGQGATVLTVNTQADNTASRRLYEGLGFEPSGREFAMFEREL